MYLGRIPPREDLEIPDRHLGLRMGGEAPVDRDALAVDAGRRRRGHEFHYSSLDAGVDARFAFDVERGDGVDGERDGRFQYGTVGTYCHVHPESCALDAFVDAL